MVRYLCFLSCVSLSISVESMSIAIVIQIESLFVLTLNAIHRSRKIRCKCFCNVHLLNSMHRISNFFRPFFPSTNTKMNMKILELFDQLVEAYLFV